jgi:hypothetical protein
MKKFLFAAIAAVAGVAGYFSYDSMTETREFTDNEMANIEALADEEGSSNSWPCWSEAKNSGGGFWRCGSPCLWIDGLTGTGPISRCYKN